MKIAAKPTGRFGASNKVDTALIEQTTAELKRLGWSSDRGRIYLQDKFGKSSRQQLTPQELQQFLIHLRSLPLPEEPQSVI